MSYDPERRPFFAPLREMWVERGDRDDWDRLHHLHYKADGTPVGAHYWKLTLDGELVGVTALGLPRPLLKDRHKAFPKLKPGNDTTFTNTARYKWINANIRVISRIVLDTMYRGVGASYRFQNLVSRMSGYPFVEIQSSMSKFNLFAQRAGFRFVKPSPSNSYAKGIQVFRECLSSHPADTNGVLAELAAMSPRLRHMTMKRLGEFYLRNSPLEITGSRGKKGDAAERIAKMPPEKLIPQLQQLVLGSPIYGFYRNPDAGRELPQRLPLTAFDEQQPEEKLKL